MTAYSVLGSVFLHRSCIKLRIREAGENGAAARQWRYFRCSLDLRKRATLDCGCSSNFLGMDSIVDFEV